MKTTLSPKRLRAHIRASDVRAAAHLATSATRGITDLVEAMHATVARPFGMANPQIEGRTSGITGFVYKSIRGITKVVATGLDATLSLITPKNALAESSFERDAAISALNGVLGDYLVETKNALAIPMNIRLRGVDVSSNNAAAIPKKEVTRKLAIFIHGLCMNDRQWLRNGHDHGAKLAQERSYTPLYVRYNTGLHTSVNGELFAAHIERVLADWPVPIDEVIIVAHSMGGLVTRSAMVFAGHAKFAWPAKLSKVVFLGTPHHGAPLERGGHWIDIVLGATPYTKPFARLGKIRSSGITDLRHGNVVESDWANDAFARTTTPLPTGIECFAVAATTGKTKRDLRDVLLGDGLVPVSSALGKHRLIKHRLAFPEGNTMIAYERNHMDLLSDQAVYEQIVEWIQREKT